MSFLISLPQLSKIIDARLQNPENLSTETPVTGINTDTRSIQSQEVFLALVGENFDGHEFAFVAQEKGATALIVSRILENITIPQLIVEDTLAAYQKIGRWWREGLNIPVIAITGSVGKTTTKELIASVLSTTGKVLKTRANYNNEIGVPKTLLEINSEHNYAVIEMGMRARGEIAILTDIAQPDIAVITNVGTAHIGRLGSKEAIAEAKCELLAQMPVSGVAILNHDNPLLLQTAEKVWQGKCLTYGLEGGDIQGELLEDNVLRVDGENFPLPLPGRHNALNYLAALAVAKVLNIDVTPLMHGLTVNLPQGRARRYCLPNDIILLDETYNAGLESMLAALELLKQTPGKRHLAVLGTMKELGEHSVELHRRVGEKVKQLEIEQLFVLVNDSEAKEIAVAAQGVNSECIATHAALITRLTQIVEPGDRVLFKASNSVGLNRVIEGVLSSFQGSHG